MAFDELKWTVAGSGLPGWGGGFPIRDIPGADWSGTPNKRLAAGLRPGAADLKAHSAEPATVPWWHSGTAPECVMICRYFCRQQVHRTPILERESCQFGDQLGVILRRFLLKGVPPQIFDHSSWGQNVI